MEGADGEIKLLSLSIYVSEKRVGSSRIQSSLDKLIYIAVVSNSILLPQLCQIRTFKSGFWSRTALSPLVQLHVTALRRCRGDKLLRAVRLPPYSGWLSTNAQCRLWKRCCTSTSWVAFYVLGSLLLGCVSRASLLSTLASMLSGKDGIISRVGIVVSPCERDNESTKDL